MKNRSKRNGGRRSKGSIVLPGDSRELAMDFVVRVPQLKNFVVTEKYSLAAFQNQAAATTYGAFSFNVNSMPNIAAYTSLFDKYKIMKVEVYFTPYLATEVLNTAPVTVPRLHTCVDQDDEAVPTSVAELEQFSTYSQVRGTAPLVRVFKPRAIMQIFQSAIATSYAVAPDVWLDLANPTIPHYGLKYAFPSSAVAGTFGYEVNVLMTAAFANVR